MSRKHPRQPIIYVITIGVSTRVEEIGSTLALHPTSPALLTDPNNNSLDPMRTAYKSNNGYCSIGLTGLASSSSSHEKARNNHDTNIAIVCHLRPTAAEALESHAGYSACDVAVLTANYILCTTSAENLTKSGTWYGRPVFDNLEDLLGALDLLTIKDEPLPPPKVHTTLGPDLSINLTIKDEPPPLPHTTQTSVVIGVMGSGSAPFPQLALPLGRWIARQGWSMINGGGGGVMTSTAQGFVDARDEENAQNSKEMKGVCVGILKSTSLQDPTIEREGYPNQYIDICIRTPLPHSGMRHGMGPLTRNHFNVLSPDVVIVLPGGPGTLSEAKLALRYGRPVIGFMGENGGVVAKRPIPCELCRSCTPACCYVADLVGLGIPIVSTLGELQIEIMKHVEEKRRKCVKNNKSNSGDGERRHVNVGESKQGQYEPI